MSFQKAREHFQRARGGSLSGGRVRNELKANEDVTEALGKSLARIESLLAQILIELRAQGGTRGLGPVADEAETDEPGFFRRWLS